MKPLESASLFVQRAIDCGKAHEGKTPFFWMRIGALRIFVSYQTVVAFKYGSESWALDYPSQTTSRHLCAKGFYADVRLKSDEFHEKLVAALARELKDQAKMAMRLDFGIRCERRKIEAVEKAEREERQRCDDLGTLFEKG